MVLDFPSTHHPMSSSSHQSSSARSSSSGGSSYFPVPSSPIPIRLGPGCWPGWLMANPPLISGSPSPESRSQNDHSEMDWDPHSEVATEEGEVVHGRWYSPVGPQLARTNRIIQDGFIAK